MSDSVPASGTQTPLERDVVPELPSSSAIAAAGVGEHFHHHGHPHSPLQGEFQTESAEGSDVRKKKKKRRGSSASRVAVDYFDPEGVSELKRTLTMQSQAARSTRSMEHRAAPGSDESTIVSEAGALDTGKFDLDQYLKDLVQRCV